MNRKKRRKIKIILVFDKLFKLKLCADPSVSSMI